MGAVGSLALMANLPCLVLLVHHRKDNLNLSSVGLRSRTDIIANTSVPVAARFPKHSRYPGLVVGIFITVLFATAAGKVLSSAWRSLRSAYQYPHRKLKVGIP